MYCSRLKRECQCTPRPRGSRSKGAGILYPFESFLSGFLQDSCTLVYKSSPKYLFTYRAKRQKKLGLLALFFCLFECDNIIKEIL